MRYARLVAGLLLGLLVSACTTTTVGVATPGVSVRMTVSAYPDLVLVPGYPVYYASGLNENYFFYDGLFWIYSDDRWYSSSWYNGPWGYVSPYYVPVFILRVPIYYYRRPPAHFHGWRSSEPPHWGQHWGKDWESRRQGWNQWDTRAVPAPAPRPEYQRRYSGKNYPRPEQQRDLHKQNYRYQPRDAVERTPVQKQEQRQELRQKQEQKAEQKQEQKADQEQWRDQRQQQQRQRQDQIQDQRRDQRQDERQDLRQDQRQNQWRNDRQVQEQEQRQERPQDRWQGQREIQREDRREEQREDRRRPEPVQEMTPPRGYPPQREYPAQRPPQYSPPPEMQQAPVIRGPRPAQVEKDDREFVPRGNRMPEDRPQGQPPQQEETLPEKKAREAAEQYDENGVPKKKRSFREQQNEERERGGFR